MINQTASERLAQSELDDRLQAFDAALPQLLQEWNAPGLGVGVVAGDQLVFARGYCATSSGFKFQVVLKEDGALYLAAIGQPEEKLLPYKGQRLRIERFAEVTFEFVMVDGQVQALVQRVPAGEYRFERV
jgi:hypothetical protein